MRMIIFRRGHSIHIDLHGLIDQHDARILYQECSRLLDEKHLNLTIDLMRASRISDLAFSTFQQIAQLFRQSNASIAFMAPHQRLQSKLTDYQLPVLALNNTAGVVSLL